MRVKPEAYSTPQPGGVASYPSLWCPIFIFVWLARNARASPFALALGMSWGISGQDTISGNCMLGIGSYQHEL